MRATTCFAKRGTKCNCLEVSRCKGYAKCPFYKGIVEYRADLNSAYMHLRRLPPEAQRAIADQYYRGRMPWALSVTLLALHEKLSRF